MLHRSRKGGEKASAMRAARLMHLLLSHRIILLASFDSLYCSPVRKNLLHLFVAGPAGNPEGFPEPGVPLPLVRLICGAKGFIGKHNRSRCGPHD